MQLKYIWLVLAGQEPSKVFTHAGLPTSPWNTASLDSFMLAENNIPPSERISTTSSWPGVHLYIFNTRAASYWCDRRIKQRWILPFTYYHGHLSSPAYVDICDGLLSNSGHRRVALSTSQDNSGKHLCIVCALGTFPCWIIQLNLITRTHWHS